MDDTASGHTESVHTESVHADEFWVNLGTGQVEQGRQSSGLNRMGPYPTRAAAEHAFETAAARNEAWEEADRRWKDDD